MTEPRARKGAKASPSGATEAVALPEPRLGETPDIVETPNAAESDMPESPPPVDSQPVAPEATAPHQRRTVGVIALLAGGAIAAVLGFGAARFAVPDGWPLAATGPINARLTAQGDALTALQADLASRAAEDRVAALETALVETRSRLAEVALAQGANPLEPRVSALEAQLADFAAQPTVEAGVSAALAGFARDLAALRAELEAQKGAGVADTRNAEAIVAAAQARMAEVEAQAAVLKAEAEATARSAARTSALAQVQAAVASGAPFADALAALQDAGQEIPPTLSAAADGLPTLAALQAGFPEAARAALDAALRADMGTSLTERMTAFLRTQTGARSLTPREGTDPDAVLSRAEALLLGGDLAGALAEIGALPPEAQAAMADWQALAERRLAATDALAALVAAQAKP
ncbi:MAG: hypothetical protein Q8Q26_16575 [Pseudorhodobacter sp.]|nr:hypothetical protein [Pseudorhodobacter sp.]